jgi:prephenate dehydratase
MKKIVYQGIAGSFSHLTALRLFGSNCQIEGLPTFRAVYEAVENCDADQALMPIENTLAGTIYETIDLLKEGSLQIVGETQARIQHSLLGKRKSSIQEIRKVFSHPKALAQCERFFFEHPWMEATAHYDTAGAAADVAEGNHPSQAAIAHATAAEIYGLEILAQGIEDHRENYTRFFLLSREGSEGNRCSLCFTIDHRPGSLADILALFAQRQINLTYIVSRPWIGKPFEYLFYVDLEGPHPAVFDELKKKTKSLKILGCYHELS